MQEKRSNPNKALQNLAGLIIIFWFVKPWIFFLLKLHFIIPKHEEYFRSIWLIVVPVAITILIKGQLRFNQFSTLRIISWFVAVFSSFFVIFWFNFLMTLCITRVSDPIYTHKIKKLEIRKIEVDCGAWDSDTSIDYSKTRVILGILIWSSIIEEKEILPAEWEKN